MYDMYREIYQYHFIYLKLDIKQQKFDFPL